MLGSTFIAEPDHGGEVRLAAADDYAPLALAFGSRGTVLQWRYRVLRPTFDRCIFRPPLQPHGVGAGRSGAR